MEYDYIDFGRRTVDFNPVAGLVPVNLDVDQRISEIKFGLNYRFGGMGPSSGGTDRRSNEQLEPGPPGALLFLHACRWSSGRCTNACSRPWRSGGCRACRDAARHFDFSAVKKLSDSTQIRLASSSSCRAS